MKNKQYGWDSAGNCLWCGEAGRCQCNHTLMVKETAKLLASAPELLEALKMVLDETNAGIWDCLPIEKARRAIALAEEGK